MLGSLIEAEAVYYSGAGEPPSVDFNGMRVQAMSTFDVQGNRAVAVLLEMPGEDEGRVPQMPDLE